jgi:enterobactin synthetase component D
VESVRLEPIDAPAIFPPFVSCYSARLPVSDHRLHFPAGRECASRALSALGVRPGAIDRGPAGEPLWPAGITGSITHKRDYVCAAVARTADVVTIGIDAEEIVNQERAERIAGMVVLPEESAAIEHLGLPLGVTLLFSIKEAVFKCLYPVVQKRFYYDAAAIIAIDTQAGTFALRLVHSLSPASPRGAVLTGRWTTTGPRVFTAVLLLASADRA